MFYGAWVCVGYVPNGESRMSEGLEVDEREVCMRDQGKLRVARAQRTRRG